VVVQADIAVALPVQAAVVPAAEAEEEIKIDKNYCNSRKRINI
jgi:hypothetical protein